MKKNLNLFRFIVLTLLLLTACNPQPKDVTEQMKDYETAWMEAYNNGDAHALAMCYTADAKLYPENSDVIEGRDAIETFWNGAMTMGMAKARPTTVNAVAVGNMAIHVGDYKSFNKDNQLIDQGKYLVTRKNGKGEWKIDKHMWATNIPESPIKGAWRLVEIKHVSNGKEAYHFPGGGFEMQQIKIWTNGHFSFSGLYSMNNESTDNYGGGTYSIDGENIYSENIEYSASKPLVGTSIKMRIEVVGNTLTQTYPVEEDGTIDEDNYSFEKYVRLD